MAFLSYRTILSKRIFPEGLVAGTYKFNVIHDSNKWVQGVYYFTTTHNIDNFGYIVLNTDTSKLITDLTISIYDSADTLLEDCTINLYDESIAAEEITDFGLVWATAGVATINGKYGFVELDAKDVNAVSAPVYSNKRDILRFNGESWVNEKFPDLAFIEEIYVKLPDESDTLNKVKTEYYQGEVFDPKGIQVYGIYSIDGVRQPPKLITGWTYPTLAFPAITSSREQVDVIISYTENNITVQTRFPVTVTKRYINKPIIVGPNNFIYNKEVQKPTISGYIPEVMEIIPGSTLSTATAGTYSITYHLKDDYAWSDETIDDYTLTWVINKASQNLIIYDELNNIIDKLNLESHQTQQIQYTNDTDNEIIYSVSTADSQYIETTLNTINKTVDLQYNGKAPDGLNPNPMFQNVVFKLIATESENYLYTEKVLSITCVYRPTLNEASWDYVAYVSHYPERDAQGNITYKNKANEYWELGAIKQVVLNGVVGNSLVFEGQICGAYIFDFNDKGTIFRLAGALKKDSQGNNQLIPLGFTDNNYDIEVFYNNTSGLAMNPNGRINSLGWKNSYMRLNILGSNTGDDGLEIQQNTIYAALYNDVKKYIKPMTVYTDNTLHESDNREENIYSESDITATQDYLPLLAASEVYADITTDSENPLKNDVGYYLMNEFELKYCKQYDYFKTNDKFIYDFNTQSVVVQQWLRSQSTQDPANASYCTISNKPNALGKIGSAFSDYSLAISPIFLIAADDIE